MIGSSIDIFHKAPEHQRRLLADPRNLPRTATINVGPELFELIVAAMLDQNGRVHRADDHLGGGDREGRDGKARGRDRGRHPGGQPAPPGPGPRPQRPRDVITAALSSVREAFGWSYGSFWEVDPDDQALRFAQDSGSVERGVPPGDRRGAVPRGRGAQRPGLADARPGLRPRPGRDEELLPRPVARRSGLKSGVCFPILLGSRVVGTMDFFTDERITPSESRLDTLRNVGRLVSTALERVDQQIAASTRPRRTWRPRSTSS